MLCFALLGRVRVVVALPLLTLAARSSSSGIISFTIGWTCSIIERRAGWINRCKTT